MLKNIIEEMKHNVEKASKVGYKAGLNELVAELRIRKADGFLVDYETVEELVVMLLGKLK